jgi:hypothetical protein
MGSPARDSELIPQTGPALEPSPAARTTSALEAAESAVHNFSIVIGGPVYDVLRRMGLIRVGLPNVFRRILVLVALTWLPLLLLSLKDGLAYGNLVRVPLLSDFSMYGRFLLGLPLLLLAEVVIDPAIRTAVAEFLDAHLVQDRELPEFERIIRRTQQLRDSWIPEAILLVSAFFPIFLFQHEWTAGAVSSWHNASRGLTAAGWWFAIFSAPLLRFIVYRWAFRYFVWGVLLWRISRLHLILIPTHPDHAAGINFLSQAQKHFGILLCALGCAFAGRVANSMVFEGAPLASFKALILGFIVMALIVGLLPLIPWVTTLTKVRKAGLLEYGRLANSYTTLFDRKWVHSTSQPGEPLLGSGDIQSLADMGNSFGLVEAMRIVPITRRLIVQLAVQAALPLIPVIILGTPTPELIRAVLKMVA